MGTIIIKPERDVDFYVGWSTIVESPAWWGTHAEVSEYLRQDRARQGGDPPNVRLARADEHGTSDMSVLDGGWADETLIYEQRGLLPRDRLAEACRLLTTNDEAAVWDLLEPFDGETEVRRDA